MFQWLRKERRGFTMIELMVVVIIVAILAAIAIPLYTKYIQNARRTEATSRLGSILTAAKAYYQENNGWPTSASANGFFGDFSSTEHWSYAQTSSGAGGAYTATATGNGTEGIASSMVISMSCPSVSQAATFTYAGF